MRVSAFPQAVWRLYEHFCNPHTNEFTVPDFRSREGLFKTLKDTHNLKGSGKQLFDASVYRDADSTSHFHDMVREMSHLSRAAKPTPFHHLIARLAHEGRLLRLYSQNVDGLETCLEPLKSQTPLPSKGPWPKTVQLHGGLEKMVCTKCRQTSDFQADLFDGPVPPFCGVCEELDHVRTEVAGKRSHGVGRLRPRMVLYNEHNPDDEAIGSVMKHDLRIRPDAVIVVGTSCKVPGVKRIVRETCAVVRDRRDGLTVWLNNDPIPTAKELESCWDLVVKGTADEVAQRAALGRWDDPDIVVEGVDEARAQAAKEKETVQVVVESPKKVTKHFDAIKDAVATAREQDACKREEEQRNISRCATAVPLATVDLGSHPPTAAPKATTAKSKLRNPASKGLTIDGYLNKAAGITTEPQAPTTKSKRAPKSSSANSTPAVTEPAKPTTTTTTKKPRAPRKPRATTKAQQAVAGTASIKSTFKTSKAAAAPIPKTRAASAAKKICDGKQAPAVVVDTDSGVRRDSTMDVLPDSSARVNSACSSPISAERVVDGSKSEKEADADASGGNTGLLRIAAEGFSKWVVGGAAS